MLLLCLLLLRLAQGNVQLQQSVVSIQNEACFAGLDVLTVRGSDLSSSSKSCADTGVPLNQTGHLLHLIKGEEQTGNVLCGSSEWNTNESCDLLQVDPDGVLQSPQISTDKLSINSARNTQALFTITASPNEMVDLICVNSPGREDCDLFRLTSSGAVIIAGEIHSAGLRSSGDISTEGSGSISSANEIVATGDLTVSGNLTVSSNADVLGNLTAQTAVINSSLSSGGLTTGALTASSISTGDLFVTNNATIGAVLATYGKFEEFVGNGSVSLQGDVILDSLSVQGTITAMGGISCLTDVNVNGSINIESNLSVAGIASVGYFDQINASNIMTEELIANQLTGSELSIGSSLNLNGSLSAVSVTAGYLQVEDSFIAGTIFSEAINSSNAYITALQVFNSSVFGGNITIEGGFELGNLSISGQLIVLGETNLSDLTVQGVLIASTGLAAYGDIVTLGNGSIISSGSVSAASNLDALYANFTSLEVINTTVTSFLKSQMLESVEFQVTGGSVLESLTILGDASFQGQVLYNGAEPITQTEMVVESLTVSGSLIVGGNISSPTIFTSNFSTGDLIVVNTSALGGVIQMSSLELTSLYVLSNLTVGGYSIFTDVYVEETLVSGKGIVSEGNVTVYGDIVSSGPILANSSLVVLGSSMFSALNVSNAITSNGIMSTFVTITKSII